MGGRETRGFEGLGKPRRYRRRLVEGAQRRAGVVTVGLKQAADTAGAHQCRVPAELAGLGLVGGQLGSGLLQPPVAPQGFGQTGPNGNSDGSGASAAASKARAAWSIIWRIVEGHSHGPAGGRRAGALELGCSRLGPRAGGGDVAPRASPIAPGRRRIRGDGIGHRDLGAALPAGVLEQRARQVRGDDGVIERPEAVVDVGEQPVGRGPQAAAEAVRAADDRLQVTFRCRPGRRTTPRRSPGRGVRARRRGPAWRPGGRRQEGSARRPFARPSSRRCSGSATTAREPVPGTLCTRASAVCQSHSNTASPARRGAASAATGSCAAGRLELVQGRAQGCPGFVGASLKVGQESSEVITAGAGRQRLEQLAPGTDLMDRAGAQPQGAGSQQPVFPQPWFRAQVGGADE